MDLERLQRAFDERFGGAPRILVRSPGRVNLIGDHTDYNQGFVLPMAIDRAVWIAARPRDDRRVIVRSLEFENPAEIDLTRLAPYRSGWHAYVAGVAWSLARSGDSPAGWEGVIGSDVPLDAGLSSSAALEMAVARVFTELGGLPWDAVAMAQVARRAENEWVGVDCGIMDPLVSGCGQSGHALLIDCRSLKIETVPVPAGVAVAVLDTGVTRRLSDSPYNRRRWECKAACRYLGVASLRDLLPARLEAGRSVIDEQVHRRARHVLAESERTLHAADALRAGDCAVFGRFMLASHQSLAEDFAVSCPELDAMVRCAVAHPACYGARLTGAGFGGCAVALVTASGVEGFLASTVAAYQTESGRTARGWICHPAEGTSLAS